MSGASASSDQEGNQSSPTPHHTPKNKFLALAVGSIGVVFGDIGTSPLYAMREALHHTRAGADPVLALYGVISIVFWTLFLLVTVKYIIFLMRADNNGEGGTLVLMALAQKAIGKSSPMILFLGMVGAALFYGDSVITPAVSVLGALEGFKDAPGVGKSLTPLIIPFSIIIMVILFTVQVKGTASMGRYFGPITLLWFLVLGILGIGQIIHHPEIFMALSPHYGVLFLLDNGFTGFIILGSVFLVVTGAEAVYADMGHFGRKPISLAWIWVVMPCLMLNYLGQGAQALENPETVSNPFWKMVPEIAYWPVLLLATAASIIASQAVITGAFSMTQQAVQLGLLPRIEIKRTSESLAGQIYIPQVNMMLMVGVLVVIILFQNSSSLTSAYGIAVTGTMMVSTIIAYIVIRRIWAWSMLKTLALLVPLGIIELVFLVSNLTKFFSGAWMPLMMALVLVLIMWTWIKGSEILFAKSRKDSIKLVDLSEMLQARPPHRASGTAIFLTSDPEMAPVALMHNLKHNKVLHEKNIVLTVKTSTTPRVDDKDRITIEVINDDFKRVTIHYGFMESPNLPKALGLCRKLGVKFDIMATSFFLGRRSVVPSSNSGMPLWQDKLFIFLMKNAANPTEYFHIPPGRVVELGTQVSV